MNQQSTTFDAKAFIEAINTNGKILPNHKIKIRISISAFNKRFLYCLYHFDEFIKTTSKSQLLLDRLTSSSVNEHSIRTAFEAHSLAFLQNLHCLADSFPYRLNIVLNKIPDTESKSIGWHLSFLEKYKNDSIFSAIEEFNKNIIFQALKNYTNHTKHKFLLPIKNTGSQLKMEIRELQQTEAHVNISASAENDLEAFMIECHDKLVPLIISLHNKLFEEVSLQNKAITN